MCGVSIPKSFTDSNIIQFLKVVFGGEMSCTQRLWGHFYRIS